MPELTLPRLGVHFSFVEAVREFHAHAAPPPYVAALDADTLSDAAAFADYVQGLLDQRWEETPRPAGYVPATTLWWTEGSEYLGRLAIPDAGRRPYRLRRTTFGSAPRSCERDAEGGIAHRPRSGN
jgi:hypothetical protein